MKGKIWFYAKDALLNYCYMVTGAFLAFVIKMFTADNTIPGYLCSLLSLVNIGVYLFIIITAYQKTGEEAMRKKHANDVERRHMLETRQFRELDKMGEHNIKNPIIFTIIAEAPLALILLITAILNLCGVPAVGLTNFIKVGFGMFYTFFYGISTLSSAYFVAFQLLLMPLGTVFGYYLGVKKAQKTYDKAERLKKRVDGEI